MNSSGERPIDTETVERLLSFRSVTVADNPCPESEIVAMALMDDPSSEENATVRSHLAHCALCREAVLALARMTTTGIIGHLLAGKEQVAFGKTRPSRRLWTQRWWIGAAAAAVIAVIFAGILWPERSREPADSPSTALAIKGSADAFFVAVQRGASQFTLNPGDPLEKEDSLGFFYSAQESGYVAIFGLEPSGEVTLVYPTGTASSASISPGQQRPLPAGAIVKEGTGCEWLIAVFSDTPMEVERLFGEVERARRHEDTCDIELEIEEARTVRTLPYRYK